MRQTCNKKDVDQKWTIFTLTSKGNAEETDFETSSVEWDRNVVIVLGTVA